MSSQNIGRFVGIGAPVIDYFSFVDEKDIPGNKGGMETIDRSSLEILKLKTKPLSHLGGSALNTIRSLNYLGRDTAVLGKRGQDKEGLFYEDALRLLEIESYLMAGDLPNAAAICLITPDGERTMRTFLGASQELVPSDISPGAFEGAALAHFEGYTLFCSGVTEKGMTLAKAAGAQISFDLSSYEMVNKFKEQLLDLTTKYVDILFSNEQEAFTLTGLPAEESCQHFQTLANVSIVTMGKKGCYIGSKGKIQHVPAYPATPLDSTGSGDLFSAGFLHAYMDGRSLYKAASFASRVAKEVLQVVGTDLSPATWSHLKQIYLTGKY